MKKITNILFIAIFAACLVLPAVTMEFGKNVISEIDNEYLPELEYETLTDLPEAVTAYVDKRIGFRQEALNLYQTINAHAFSVMEHPIYMYGKNGHLYLKDSEFIKNYQRLNVDQEYPNVFTKALSRFYTYTQEKGIDFLYFYIPDKETIYPEFYPEGINVYDDFSRTELILGYLSAREIPYYFAKDAMLAEKAFLPVNNTMYDVGHWNHHGAFAAIRQLYTILQQNHPQLQPIEKEEFLIETEVMKYLQTSQFVINEEVPVYSLKQTSAINKTQELRERILISYPDNYVAHYENPEQADQPKLLIFGDSYLAEQDLFFINHFSEYTYIHRYNVYNQEFFQYYVDALNPDIVIYENPERSHEINLYMRETLN